MPVPDYNYTRPRGPIGAMQKGPGPIYSLPTLTGHSEHDPRSVHQRGPAYPFGSRVKYPSADCSPGPCHLPDAKLLRIGREPGRSYSIYPRLNELSRFSAPAPGRYDIGSTALVKTRAPIYSFGVTYPPLKSSDGPGPGAYQTPSALGRSFEGDKRQAPSYSIYGRSKTGGFDEDFKKTPGPGAYSLVDANKYKVQYPQYSLKSRNYMPDDRTQKPGPGTYLPAVNDKKIAPQYTFGIRHSEYEAPLIVDGAAD